MRGASLVFIALLVTFLAGCAGDEPTDPGTTTSTGPATDTTTDTTTSTPGEAPRRDPVTWVVEVRDNSFSPADLTIQRGDTVRWEHVGGNPHTVTAGDGAFDSHPECTSFADSALDRCMETDDTFEHTFDANGDVDYYCKIHAPMTGMVRVLERHDATP